MLCASKLHSSHNLYTSLLFSGIGFPSLHKLINSFLFIHFTSFLIKFPSKNILEISIYCD
uniref:Uncharacterized protein n=1 Tax=Tetragenococcus halophilus TaxID=51669 RepID=F1SZK1_TETHA|nr:hypothetical protein [Tetragenococcus halophilus]BAJ84472.1 hypothetical protein [Tetragenococcus halophilus HO]